MLSAEFLLSTLVVVLIPGTGVLYTLAVGMTCGARASAFAAAGCTLGILPAVLAALLGLSAILHSGALAYQALRWAGAAYLLYLAWATWRDRGPIRFDRTAPMGAWRIARTGALINVLNPKLALFFFAFLPQFIDPAAGSAALQILFFGLLFLALLCGRLPHMLGRDIGCLLGVGLGVADAEAVLVRHCFLD